MYSTSRGRFATACAALLLLLLSALAGCALTGAPTAGTSPTVAVPPTTPALSTSTPPPAWQVYHDPLFSFSVEVPGVLIPVIPPGEPTSTDISYQYDYTKGAPPTAQATAAETVILISATTASPIVCSFGTAGTPTTIGQGVTAYVENDLFATPRPSGGGAFPLHAQILSGGVFIEIDMTGQAKAPDFMARYGAIWQHILDSFVPGPPVPNTHPCG